MLISKVSNIKCNLYQLVIIQFINNQRSVFYSKIIWLKLKGFSSSFLLILVLRFSNDVWNYYDFSGITAKSSYSAKPVKFFNAFFLISMILCESFFVSFCVCFRWRAYFSAFIISGSCYLSGVSIHNW